MKYSAKKIAVFTTYVGNISQLYKNVCLKEDWVFIYMFLGFYPHAISVWPFLSEPQSVLWPQQFQLPPVGTGNLRAMYTAITIIAIYNR